MKKGQVTKKTIIKEIGKIIREYGSFTTADVNAESSPSIHQFKGINQLAEMFLNEKVKAITYDRNDDEIDEEFISYDNLNREVLDEILDLAKTWETECVNDEIIN